MHLPRTLRKGLLSVLFGTVVAQGLLPAAAQAQNAPAAPAAASEPQTRASADLERMRQYYQHRAPRNVIIGALDTDTLLSFTRDDDQSLGAAIRGGGAVPDDASLARLAEGITFLPGIYSENANFDHQTLSPVAVPDLHAVDGRAMCVTITGQPDIQTILPTGLNVAQSTRFLNRHEFRHCASAHISHTLQNHGTVAQSVQRGELSPALFDYLAGVLEEETRADLGALSDMIVLDGDSADILRSVADWRARRMAASQHDLTHYSSPALLALAERIDEMGVARFRRMGEGARERLLERVLHDTRLSGGAMLLLAADVYDGAVEDVNYPLTPGDHARAAPALAYIAANPHLQHVDMDPIILTPAQMRELQAWSPEDDMQKRALSEGRGSVTRLSLLAARSDMLDTLREDIRRDPSNPVYGARILLTHAAFQSLSATLDAPAPIAGPAAQAQAVMAATAAPSGP